jgi:excisionase family DNA binding protein
MSIKTLDLKEAARFLKITPEGLRRKAARGEIPGAKPGKCWCFREDDLADYIRSLYRSSEATLISSYLLKKAFSHAAKKIPLRKISLTTEEKEYRQTLGLPDKAFTINR